VAPAVTDAFKGDGHPLPLCGAYNEEIAIYERWEGSDVNARPAPRCGYSGAFCGAMDIALLGTALDCLLLACFSKLCGGPPKR